MKKTVMFLALILFLFSPAFARIYQVPSAFIGTIQGGINVAKNGDTVLVMPRTYYENINFKGKNILVTSKFIFDQNDSTVQKTIIDGSNKGSVVTFNSHEDSTACIQGFTITHGCHSHGGGIFCDSSSPRIAYNIISENVADPVCVDPGYFFWTATGGGIDCLECSGLIEHNFITRNECLRFEDDGGSGGGIHFYGKVGPIIRFNLISFNKVKDGSGGGIWGGDSCTTYIYNNTIISNYSYSGGGIFYVGLLTETKIFNNIIAFNTEGVRSFYIPNYTNRPTLAYNDFWNNGQGHIIDFSTEVGDTTWGFNRNGVPCDSFHNIIRDPLFVDTANFDFHLLVNSPCIDAGDPTSPMDPDSTIADIGVFYFPHSPTFVKDDDHNTPQRFELSQNYPNPFNPTTRIQFRVSSLEFGNPAQTTLKVYNILGQLVRTLVDEEKMPGKYKINWDGKDDSGKEVGSGIYFYQLRTRDYTDTKKMVLLR